MSAALLQIQPSEQCFERGAFVASISSMMRTDFNFPHVTQLISDEKGTPSKASTSEAHSVIEV